MLKSNKVARKITMNEAAESFNYKHLPYSVREDLPQAYRNIWARLRKPGNWWTGEDRVSIAAETRAAIQCQLCLARKSALSPFSIDGTHNCVSNLPTTAIDAVHRLTSDPSRLTEKWLSDGVRQGLSHEKYIELLGIVVAVISIDAFHKSLDLALEPLPEPLHGQPNQYRPSSSAEIGAWIETVPPRMAVEEDADIYGGRNQTANVITAMSLVPDSVRMLRTLAAVQYLEDNDVIDPSKNGNRKISRAQMEMLAGRVSSLSGCFY